MTDAHEGRIESRDYAVLLAVYAIIGDKQYAIIRRDRVRAGAMGYSSAKVLFDKDGKLTVAGKRVLAGRADGAKPLTLDQVRYTLDKLHERKFFSRIQPKRCGRSVYYSRGMDHAGLAEKLIGRLERKSGVATAKQFAELNLREKAALLKRGISGDSSVHNKPVFVPAQSPGVTQTTPAGVPAPVPAVVPALILSCPNECLPNSFSPNACSPNGSGEPLACVDKKKNPILEPGEFKRRALAAIEEEERKRTKPR